jgi:hypothetical protein
VYSVAPHSEPPVVGTQPFKPDVGSVHTGVGVSLDVSPPASLATSVGASLTGASVATSLFGASLGASLVVPESTTDAGHPDGSQFQRNVEPVQLAALDAHTPLPSAYAHQPHPTMGVQSPHVLTPLHRSSGLAA